MTTRSTQLKTLSTPSSYLFEVHTKEGANPRISYSYPIVVRSEPDWDEFHACLDALHADHFTLIADAGLPPALIQLVYAHLQAGGVPCLLILLAPDEQQKTMETVQSIYTQARSAGGATHASCFVTLGGGVIGNIAGLAASVVVRGIKLVHIPTTLLAGTDSILSCKQGVNESIRESSGSDRLVKNLVGAFHAPELVLVYTAFWHSLPADEIRSGLCELVKNVVAIHPHLYDHVLHLLNPQACYTDQEYQQIFAWCFAAKQHVMRKDAHEQGPALVLELGHEVAHALEICAGYRHGYAVGLGLLVSAQIAWQRGALCGEDLQKHSALLRKNGAPTSLPASVEIEEVLRGIHNDNKIGYFPRVAGFHAMVVLKQLGQPQRHGSLPLTYVSEEHELRAALHAIQVQPREDETGLFLLTTE